MGGIKRGVCVGSDVFGFSPGIRRPRCPRTRRSQGQGRRKSLGYRSETCSTCCPGRRMCGISIPSSRSTRNKSCSILWGRSRPSNSESAGKRRENKRKSRGPGQESGKVSVLTSFHAKARTGRQAFINDITYDIIRRKHGYDRRIARGTAPQPSPRAIS